MAYQRFGVVFEHLSLETVLDQLVFDHRFLKVARIEFLEHLISSFDSDCISSQRENLSLHLKFFHKKGQILIGRSEDVKVDGLHPHLK